MSHFSSDRSHMYNTITKEWSAPPPPYPCIVSRFHGCNSNPDSSSSALLLHISSFSSFYSASFSTTLRGGGGDGGGGHVVVPGVATSKSLSSRRSSRMVLSVSLGGSSTSTNEESDNNDPSSRSSSTLAQGRLLLFLVALLYGTLNVTLRFVYNTPLPNGAPISASALSAIRGWMATLCFIPLWPVYKPQRNHAPRPPTKEESTVLASTTTTTNDDIDALPFPPPHPSSSLWKADLELGIWNFGAQDLLNIGSPKTLHQQQRLVLSILASFSDRFCPKNHKRIDRFVSFVVAFSPNVRF
jgi:N-terminal glutamine amidase